MTKLGNVLVAPGQTQNCLPLVKRVVSPGVWATQGSYCPALTVTPIRVHLKDPTIFPSENKYPLRPEAHEDPIKIIENLKGQSSQGMQ